MAQRKIQLVLLGALLLGTACEKADSPTQKQAQIVSAKSPLTWKSGQSASYSLVLSSMMKSPGMAQQIEFELSAKLDATVLSIAEETVKLSLAVTDASFKTAEGQQEQFAKLIPELRGPYVVTYDNGSISEEGIGKGTSKFAASILRTLGAALQFGATKAENRPWTTTEYDGTGGYEIEYTPGKEGTWVRKKVKYSALDLPKTRGLPVRSLVPKVASSVGEISLTKGLIGELSYAEEIELSAGVASISGKTRLSLNLEKTLDAAPAPDIATELVVLKPGTAYGAARDAAELEKLRIGDYTFERALSELVFEAQERKKSGNRAASSNRRAFSAMAAILRTQPEKLATATKVVKEGEVVAGVIADALSSAGTPEAQAALVSLLSEKIEIRTIGATSLVRVQNPTVTTEKAVRELCDSPRFISFCLYGLGSFARKLRDAGETERAEKIGGELMSRLGTAKSHLEQTLTLRGLANAAEPRSLAAVKPFLSNETDKLRQAAVDALRLVPGADVDAILVERLQKDESVAVRTSVVSAAGVRETSPLLVEAIKTRALEDSNSGIRKKALQLLIKWLPTMPELREAIQTISQKDSNEAVKTLAEKALQKA